jgi:hypothetical protein
MPSPGRLVPLSVAVALAAALAVPAALAGKDDAADLKKKRDDYKAKLKEEKKLPFHDLSYYADLNVPKEFRWSQTDPPTSHDLSEKKGVQFRAAFALKEGSPPVIQVIVQKFLAKEGNSTFSVPFEYAGFSAPVGDKKKMVEGFYLDWIKKSSEPVQDKCSKEPKKVSAGPADLFGTAVATDKESKKRERRDVFGWLGEGATWIAWFEYPDYEMVEKGKLDEKVLDLMKCLKDAKPPK